MTKLTINQQIARLEKKQEAMNATFDKEIQRLATIDLFRLDRPEMLLSAR